MVTSAQDTFKAVISSVGSAVGGGVANSSKPVIAGTAPAGETVYIYDGVRFLGTATVAANGTWSFTPTADLKGGVHQFTAIAVDALGQSGASSTPISVSVPSSAPVAPPKPIINGMTDDNGHPLTDPTNDAHPNISGTGVPGDTITVYDGPTPIGSTTVAGDGTWTVKPTNDLPSGNHDIYVIDTNPAGVPSVPSDHMPIVVDTSVPATPAAPVLTDDSGATIPAGSTTADAHPHISGTGTAGDVIKVYDGATVIGSTTIGADGKWTLEPTTDLSTGPHDLHVTETNPAGTTSPDSPTTHITIQTQSVPATPAAPVIMDHHDASIPAGATTFDTKPYISGHGTAGDTITVYDGSTVLGSVTVAGDGTWTFTPSAALPFGSHSVNVTESNAAGASGHSAAASFTLQQTSVVITAVTDPLGHLIPVGGDISGTITVTGTVTGFADGDRVVITYAGTAASSTGNPQTYITAVVTNGTFSATFTGDMTSGGWPLFSGQPGTVNLQAIGLLAAGHCESSTYLVNETNWAGVSIPTTPAAPVMTDHHDASIPAGATTFDTKPHISGHGAAGDTITVYDGSTVLGSVTVAGDGTWTFTPSAALPFGSHSVNVTESNAAGTSAHSAAASFMLQQTSIVITSVTDQLGHVIPAGGDASGPITVTGTVTGFADGDRVIISVDGTAHDPNASFAANYVIATVNNGTFSYTLAADTATSGRNLFGGAGTINLIAHGTLAAGNCDSAPYLVNEINWAGVSIPTTPAAPVLTDDSGATIPAGSTTSDGHPHISGTGTAGDTITVYDGNTVIGTATVKGDGTWTFTPAADLATGSHSISVTEMNAAGESAHSASTAFTYDTHPGPAETVSITQLLDQSMGLNTVILNNGQTYCTNPLLQGALSSQLLAGETVQVYRDGVAVGTATVSGKSWSYSDSGVPDGSHLYTAKVVSSAGSGALSDPYHITELVHSGNGQVALLQLDATTYRVLFDASKVPDSQIPNLMLTFGSSNAGTMYWAPTSSAWAPTYYLNQISGTKIFYADVPTDWVFWPQTPQYATSLAWGLFDGVKDTYYDGRPASMFVPNYWAPADQKVSGNSNYNTPPQSALDAAAAVNKVVYTGVLHAVSDANTDPVAVDATQPSESTPSTEQHHTTVAQHDAFTGHTGYDTIDLNVDPTSYFKEATAHIQGSTDHAVLPTGAAPAVNTLHLTGDHQVLDLTSLTGKTAAAKISGIEVIDLGGHANTLKVSLLDVLNLGEQDLFQKDGKQQMMVNGSDGDKVDLANSHIAGVADGQWEQHGTAQVGGVMYNVYEHSGAHTELLVQQGVQIVVH